MKSKNHFEPFGIELPPINSTDNRIKYTGQERDTFTNYDYMHFRFYASSMGRFLKPDNIIPDLTNPKNWNLYSYVRGNPVNMNDPTGHQGEETNAKLPQSGGDPNAQVEAKEQIKEEQSENKDKESNKPPQGAGDQAREFVGPPTLEETLLANVIYNETGSLSPNPEAKPGEKGSAEDLHAGRVAVGEIANRVLNGPNPERVLVSTQLNKQEDVAISAGNPKAVAAFADSVSAAMTVLGGSNTTNGATQYRTRPNSDVTTNVGREGPKIPGTPVFLSFGPFKNSISKSGIGVIVVAP